LKARRKSRAYRVSFLLSFLRKQCLHGILALHFWALALQLIYLQSRTKLLEKVFSIMSTFLRNKTISETMPLQKENPFPQFNVASHKCPEIRLSFEYTTTLLSGEGGEGRTGTATMFRKMLSKYTIFSTVLSKIVAGKSLPARVITCACSCTTLLKCLIVLYWPFHSWLHPSPSLFSHVLFHYWKWWLSVCKVPGRGSQGMWAHSWVACRVGSSASVLGAWL